MTTIESLCLDSDAGAMQTLDQAELADVDGGQAPDEGIVIDLRPSHLGTSLARLVSKIGSFLT